MTRIELFEKVLEKLKFREPVPEAVKRFVLHNKPAALIKTLKEAGEYSLVYNYVLKIYYTLGRSGRGVSVAQSKLILSLAAALLGVSVSAGAVLSYKYFINNDTVLQEIKMNTEDAVEKPVKMPDIDPVKTEEIAGQSVITEKNNTSGRSEVKSRKMDQIPPEKKSEIKKMSVVQTKDGKTYTGSFRSLGENVEVNTGDEIILIPSENIQTISPYKGN